MGRLGGSENAEEGEDPEAPGMPKAKDDSMELELRVHQLPSRSHACKRFGPVSWPIGHPRVFLYG